MARASKQPFLEKALTENNPFRKRVNRKHFFRKESNVKETNRGLYEGGVFKPIGKADLKEGIKGVVLLRSEGIADILEKYSRKVERDVLHEFLAERR